MYSTKVLLSMAALAGVSHAQIYTDPVCNSSYVALLAAAPTLAPELIEGISDIVSNGGIALNPDILSNPLGFKNSLCSLAVELPSSLLPEFASWGAGLLSYANAERSSYDAFITQCVTTGAVAASYTSYIHSLATATGDICAETTGAPSAGNSTSNGTISASPTLSPALTYPGATSTIPTAAAIRASGVFVGAGAVAGLLGAVALL
jgi:hypothetical protein